MVGANLTQDLIGSYFGDKRISALTNNQGHLSNIDELGWYRVIYVPRNRSVFLLEERKDETINW